MSPLDPGRLYSPVEWGDALSAPPVISSGQTDWPGALLRSWRGIEPVSYPRLDHHCLTLHLGNPRRIERRGEGSNLEVDIRPGALSLTPSGAAYEWKTTGPVDYAELYLSPAFIRQIDAEVFDRGGSGFGLEDRLGIVDPMIEMALKMMLGEIAEMRLGSRLYLDSLLRTLSIRLLQMCGNARPVRPGARHSIAPARLRRVLEYIETHLSADIGITVLAEVAAISAAHFSRVFAQATGVPPYAYVVARRIEHAKRLLANPELPLSAVAASCGFHTEAHFSRMFTREVGVTPRQYRLNL